MSDYKPVEKLNYTFYKFIHISKDLSELCYVGSTANMVSRRANHKSNCNNANSKLHNTLLYRTMRENGGFNNFKMIILGTAEQVTKREAQAIEEEYRIKEKANLNSFRCYTTEEQKAEQLTECDKKYRQNNKAKITQYRQEHKDETKQYYQDHKKEFTEKARQYYQEHKAEIAEKARQYYQDNKAELAKYQKQYRQANKELINERRRKNYQAKKALQAQVEE
jgi:hypothetical protein